MQASQTPLENVKIRVFTADDTDRVVALWQECGLTRPWNDPYRDIERKLDDGGDLFLVAVVNEKILASVMAGYEGHRGWVYYLAVAKEARKLSLGRMLMQTVEQRLIALGCPKINLMVRSSNEDVTAFYRKLGYSQDEVIALGKRLIVDAPRHDE